jgi:hypothetical protein
MQRVHLSGEFLVHGTTHAFCCTEAVYLTVPAPDPAEHPIADDRNWKHSQGAKSTELSKIETLCLGRANLLKKFRTSSQKLEAIANAQQSVLQDPLGTALSDLAAPMPDAIAFLLPALRFWSARPSEHKHTPP